jgi:hypothetical protein
MSLLTFAQAPSPWHLKCRNCKTKLKPRKHSILIAVISGIFGLSIVLVREALRLPTSSLLVLLIFGIIIFEVSAFYICQLLELKLEIRE